MHAASKEADMKNEGLRILVRREDDVLVAQCVDYDICTQADDLPTLQARMDALIDAELNVADRNGTPLPPAPKAFERMWEENSGSPHSYRIEQSAA